VDVTLWRIRNTHDAPESSLCEKHYVISKTRGTTTSDEDQATATGNTHKSLVEFGRVVSEICEWLDKQTDILITSFRTLPEGEVINANHYYTRPRWYRPLICHQLKLEPV